ncbi:MAG: response regulator [Planctomycetes bacterium]|jgi:CheY-like chemotaxis protein|nr:response regulator [Planctomycetota bacterium]
MSSNGTDTSDTYKVLLVDDDRDQRLLTWDVICMNAGPCVVRDAASSEEALAMLTGRVGDGPYDADVVYVDIEMPGMSGLNLLQEVRRDPHLNDTTVFVVSGSTDEGGRRLARQLGADGFITKSSDVGRMMLDLRETFGRWQRRAGRHDEIHREGAYT